ncbi:MAG: TrkA family potassium uptake protein [Deltaproteobacteria bacterium]|nr:TrkA family potassium uptake protein [Deltaproteobacteria bacterium]
MAKQFLIIGLGQFGISVARSLAEKGAEILAVDADADRVRVAADLVDDAVVFDATDEQALARTAPDRRDACVCAIGSESKEASIICSALLRQHGAKRLIARASDPLHERILRLVGAHEIVNPDREYGERLANRLIYQGVIGEMPLGEDLVITEFSLPDAFVGRTLIELALPRRFSITIVAVRRGESRVILMPDPNAPLEAGDVLVVVSAPGAVARLTERY